MESESEATHSDRPGSESDLVLPEGLEVGLIGAGTVVLVYLFRDLGAGNWLHTPTVLGTLILRGPEAARTVVSDPGIAVVYNLIHFALWIAIGFTGSALMKLAERRPELRFLPLFLLAGMIALCFALDAEVRETYLGRVHLWIGALTSGSAVTAYLLWRHPGVLTAEPPEAP